jgi:hypothetical protein|tara:strand:+ start:1544 stop:1873 length:330 start_codon:yes stop_codon:yes gene_type:complete
MGLLYLTQGGSEDLDLSNDGFTDSFDNSFFGGIPKDLQILRTSGTGQPLLTFEISNDGINWASWEIVGFIFKDLTHFFEFESFTKETFFRVSWLSNSSTGIFKSYFKSL